MHSQYIFTLSYMKISIVRDAISILNESKFLTFTDVSFFFQQKMHTNKCHISQCSSFEDRKGKKKKKKENIFETYHKFVVEKRRAIFFLSEE